MGEASAIVRSLALFIAASVLAAPSAQAATRKPAVQLLNSLPVAAEETSGYSRDLFRHWIRQADGCTTRQDVLIDERTAGSVSGCSVVNGRWTSFYDGVTTTNPRSLDIDHMVPLKEAWDSGAWRWNAATRQAYANDLGYGLSLVAVTASANRSKSDRDPAEWMPARGRCSYAKAWIGVKYRWRLSVDAPEKRALASALQGCPTTMTVPPIAARTNASTVAPAPTGSAAPETSSAGLDPRFRTCGEANAAGYGPYVRGQDPEYAWYIDRDKDGVACES